MSTNRVYSSFPRGAMLGIVSGVFFFTFFGAGWASWGGSYLQGTPALIDTIITFIITIALLALSIYVLVASRHLPQETIQEEAAYWKKSGRTFGIIFGLEALLIAISNIILFRTGHQIFLAPITTFIVGIHFLPLAKVFRLNAHYVTGMFLALLGLVSSAGIWLNPGSPNNWILLATLGSALLLWCSAIFLISQCLRLLRPAITAVRA